MNPALKRHAPRFPFALPSVIKYENKPITEPD